MLARELGKSLNEVLDLPGPITNRQYLTWLAWLDSEWNVPSRSDFYAMQVAQEVRRVLHKNPNSVKLESMKIPFKRKTEESSGDSTVQMAQGQISKSLALASMTMEVRHVVIQPEDVEPIRHKPPGPYRKTP